MVALAKPPLTRERRAHVCFTFGNANTGAKDGWGRLYLDGVPAGEFRGWENTFRWDVEQNALTLGYSYTGLIDDIAVFNRALSDAEVKAVFGLPKGIAGLHR
jgi:hypothetical protein